jgi:hypothetical protein
MLNFPAGIARHRKAFPVAGGQFSEDGLGAGSLCPPSLGTSLHDFNLTMVQNRTIVRKCARGQAEQIRGLEYSDEARRA